MKKEKLTLILLLILIFGCQEVKNSSESKSSEKKEIFKTHTDSTKNLIINSEKNIYRNITELEKYKGFEQVSAQVLGSSNKALVYIQKDSLKVLILEKIIKNSSPKPNYSILDEVNLIFINSEQYIALTHCDLIENPDEKMVFSLVVDEDVEYFDKVLKSWNIDLKENKFKEIETKKVKCLNEWFGYDG